MILAKRADGNILNLGIAERFLQDGDHMWAWINGEKYFILNMHHKYIVQYSTPKLADTEWKSQTELDDADFRQK